MKNISHFLMISLVLLCLTLQGKAQDSIPTTDEVWPELDVYYKINSKFRLFLLISGTRNKDSYYTDGSIGVNLDYFTYPRFRKLTEIDSVRGQHLWFRIGYMYATSPPQAEDPFREHTLRADANSRYYFLPWETLLAFDNRFDGRFSNDEFKLRYRPKLEIGRDFKADYLTFYSYLYWEYFWDFNNSSLNRNRLCIGTEFRVANKVNFEIYFLRQYPNAQVASVKAAGLALKIYFSPLKKKPKTDKTN